MRLFDIALSLLLLCILSPLFIVVIFLIRIDSSGSAFFVSERVGKNRQIFRLYKFRSMISEANQIGPKVTSAHDHRVTNMGRVIRKSKIDELPQLWNVVIGDMRLVGPRPEDPKYVKYYNHNQLKVFEVYPGITSPASIAFSNEEKMLSGANWEQIYINQILPKKLEMEIEYIEKRSAWTDIQVMFQTMGVLSGPNRYRES